MTDQTLVLRPISRTLVLYPKGRPGRDGTGDGGGSLPTGGTVGQILTKQSSANGDATWANIDCGTFN